MSKPLISIIIPVLNRVDTLEKAILSVLQQTYTHYELIIIDGASTDGTIEVIKRYAHHLAYWHSERDGNPIVAANFGMQKAKGELVALLMADDWYEPQLLEKIANAYQKAPDNDMYTCGGSIVNYDATSNTYVTEMAFATEKALKLSFYNVCFAASGICCRFIKKELFMRIGWYQPFDANGKHIFSNDKEFLLRAILHGAKDQFVDYLGYHYLAHPDSATFGRNRHNIIRLCEEHMQIAEQFLQDHPLHLTQRLLLNYWYHDQSARLIVYLLLDKQLTRAFCILKQALKKNALLWPLSFLVTSGRILMKKAF